MKNYKIGVVIPCPDDDKARELGDALQAAANAIPFADILRLLQAVKKKPSVVKTALKFV